MKYLLTLTLIVVLSSCATKKEILYFQDSESLDEQKVAQAFDPIIETNDILHVSLSSSSNEGLAPFVKKNIPEVGAAQANDPSLEGYLVDVDGNIKFPVVGAIAVAGKTRKDVENSLKTELLTFVKDVVVDVRIVNFKITVLGEVENPGVFVIKDERVTLPQALGLAGDLTLDAKRDNIKILREENGVQKVKNIDLTSTSFFTSDFYFLKQNDIVYIEPSLKGVKKSGFVPDVPALLSLFTVVLSAVIIITR